MSFADLDTLGAVYANLFGAGVGQVMLGLVIALTMLAFMMTIGLGFEATAAIMAMLSYVLIDQGLLPRWMLTLVYFFGAAVLVAAIMRVLRK